MTLSLSAAALLLTLQAAAPAPPPVVIIDFSQLPVAEATGPRCGVAFAIVQGAQEAGDAQAKKWPDLGKANAREFFVKALAKLMDDRKLNRDEVAVLVKRESERLAAENDKRANAMMPACLMLLGASGE